MELIRRKSGFTLIELLVVVIIVAVLAAVGVPLLSANVQRAKLSEAESGLGAIKTAMQAQFVEKGAYPAAGTALTTMGFGTTDLDGRFLLQSDYAIVTPATGRQFCLAATTPSGPGADASISTKDRSMDDQGSIWDSGNCTGTKLN